MAAKEVFRVVRAVALPVAVVVALPVVVVAVAVAGDITCGFDGLRNRHR